MSSWLPLPANTGFGPDTLPYGVVGSRVVVPLGDQLLDLATALARVDGTLARLVDRPTLDPLLAAGRPTWDAVRTTLRRMLTVDTPEHRRAVEAALRDPRPPPQLPFTVADYADFYSSEQHATNVGRIFRPDAPALPPAWKHVPIGYHGRSGTVVVSGTPVRRPRGILGPGRGTGRASGSTSRPRWASSSAPRHALGVAGARRRLARARLRGGLLNDWSARDIQSFEPGRSGRSWASRSSPRSRPGWCRSRRWSRRSSTRRRRTRARSTTCSRPARRST